MASHFHSLKVKEIIQETPSSVAIQFDIPNDVLTEFQYLAGQYLTLRKDINGEDVRRSYSLCSAPYETQWKIGVKHVEGGKFSSYATKELKAGDVIDVMPPMGSFTLKPDSTASKNYILVAAGSGITPILSLLKTILKEEERSTVTLFYGNQNTGSIMFREEIEALKNEYIERLSLVHILSKESLGNPIQKGRIDDEKAKKLVATFLADEEIDAVYVCGPESMIHAVKAAFLEKGLPEKNIHYELFGVPVNTKSKAQESVEEIVAEVKVIIDGDAIDITLNSKDVSILDAAHKGGADLPFACKGGVCCTCKAKILEGSARMDVNYALDADEVAAGYILTCQAHPTSEKLVVSFDD